MSPHRSNPRRFLAVAGAAVALVATSCAHNAPGDTLKPAGPESRFIDSRFFPVFWIAVAVFCLVFGLVVYCVIRFRDKGDDRAPKQIHGNAKLEIGWTALPLVLLLVIGGFSVQGIFYLARTPKGAPIAVTSASATSPITVAGDVLHVNVIAHRWWFEFRYPGLGAIDPATGTRGDLVTAGELHIPVRKNVYLDITSNEPAGSPEGKGGGVIHNFWIPKLAGKIYAIPGRHAKLILNADNPGTYVGQCTEFCGLSHANMRTRAVAQTADDFAAWVSGQEQPAKVFTAADQFTSGDAYAGFQQFRGVGNCAGCHSVDGTSAVGKIGPNLTHLQSRSYFAGALLPLTDANLRMWLRNPQAVKPGANMRIPVKLTDDQITPLIAYLDTLK